MWYRNKRTELTWDVTDEDLLKRISKDPDFEPAEDLGDANNGEDVNLGAMSYDELKRTGTELGIKFPGNISKAELTAAILTARGGGQS